ncbi:hypothetical protein DL96DRAFT_1537497 [Flagelloscypha sp. PMI_526]|nr:hypothetical protein DL96DRAFT_1537497 [Flagelloscypha sp. PMI_526]
MDLVYARAMPMRTPMLWSETLMNSVMKSNVPNPKPTNPSTSSVSLQERGMTDSFYEFTLPFFSDPILLEEYTNAPGVIRTGKLIESLDSLTRNLDFVRSI